MEFITLFGKPGKKEPGILEKIRGAVTATRENFTEKIQDLVQGKKEIDPVMLDELEAILLGADVGVVTTSEIIDTIREKVSRKLLADPDELRTAIQDEVRKTLEIPNKAPTEAPEGQPFVILMVGVNGVGKTTTIGKLARRFTDAGKTVVLSASDTFRAAAIEQLEVWAGRAQVDIVKQKPGADPSAVLYDGITRAKAIKADYIIVDTAGRLHTKHNLMAELEKMTRVAKREIPGAPHEVLLVLDATTGQNGLIQAREFTRTSGVTGLVLTKLDGTAKGGVVVAIARELKIPIRFVGVGEKASDLVEFSPSDFVASLFS